MQIAESVLGIDHRFAGEPCVRESGKHGSEGGGWKSVLAWEAARWPPTLHLGLPFRSHAVTRATPGTYGGNRRYCGTVEPVACGSAHGKKSARNLGLSMKNDPIYGNVGNAVGLKSLSVH